MTTTNHTTGQTGSNNHQDPAEVVRMTTQAPQSRCKQRFARYGGYDLICYSVTKHTQRFDTYAITCFGRFFVQNGFLISFLYNAQVAALIIQRSNFERGRASRVCGRLHWGADELDIGPIIYAHMWGIKLVDAVSRVGCLGQMMKRITHVLCPLCATCHAVELLHSTYTLARSVPSLQLLKWSW